MSQSNSTHEQSSVLPSSRETNSFDLKLCAIICMTFDHAGYIFFNQLPFWTICLFMSVGGATFPLMAFQLAEGYRHTSNINRYMGRLGIFALVSQIPFQLFLGSDLNIMFTLLISLVVLYLDDRISQRWIQLCVLLGGCLVSMACDWAVLGVLLVYLFKKIPESDIAPAKALRATIFLCMACIALPTLVDIIATASLSQLPFALFGIVGPLIALSFIGKYNGALGRPLKYFFYIYYPGHIAILGLLYMALFGAIPPLM